MTSSKYFQLEKFNGKNFRVWKYTMQSILTHKGLINIVNGSETRPTDDSDNKQVQWDKREAKAKMLLITGLDVNQRMMVMTCERSSEIWDYLLTMHEQKSENSKLIAEQRFNNLRYETGSSIEQLISSVKNLAQDIRNTGESISELRIIAKIIDSLPDSYESFKMSWSLVDSSKQRLDVLTALLSQEEQRKKSSEENAAFLSESRKNTKPNNYYKSDRRNKNSLKVKDRKQFDKREIKCYGCKGRGHILRNCPMNKNSDQRNSEQPARAYSAQVVDQANVSIYDADEWISDSGATNHMSFRKDWFINLKISENLGNVVLGSESILKIVGVGDIPILELVHNKWEHSIIKDVLFVPDLKKNLFSEGYALRKVTR